MSVFQQTDFGNEIVLLLPSGEVEKMVRLQYQMVADANFFAIAPGEPGTVSALPFGRVEKRPSEGAIFDFCSSRG